MNADLLQAEIVSPSARPEEHLRQFDKQSFRVAGSQEDLGNP